MTKVKNAGKSVRREKSAAEKTEKGSKMALKGIFEFHEKKNLLTKRL